MLTLLFLIPTIPLVSSLALGLIGRRLPRGLVAIIGTGSIGLSTALSLWIGAQFLTSPPPANAYTQTLWTWMSVGNFQPEIAFRLDALSLVMTLVVCFVSFLIHLYSVEFMAEDEGYSRFFSYMNFFVSSMLILILADNLLFLYLGWEGVGLCSYLLIGFWYKDPANGLAARKAFIATRIGDTAMAIGLFLLFKNLGTLQIQDLLQNASQQWPVGSGLATAAAALLLCGAVGKSAQLPLQTWLPDAMAGPTPVSALIHAATMVTAGVYLIARTHTLFVLAPAVQLIIAIIGAATLLIAGFSALTQTDIKRILAYSTMSQIGYMFLALGVGAWSAAIFHFVTHAFFKALLFLAAGAVIVAVHDEHNIFKMGGLRKEMPRMFWTFLIGAASLSAVPFITSGFYSKDLILSQAYESPIGGTWFWAAGLLGAFLTSLYTFRMFFVVFFGQAQAQVKHKLGALIFIPILILSFLSLVGGFINLPPFFGDHPFFSDFLLSVFPTSSIIEPQTLSDGWLAFIASIVSFAGIACAYVFYVKFPNWLKQLREFKAFGSMSHFFSVGWGFDFVYDLLLVRPFIYFSEINHNDAFDLIFDGIAAVTIFLNKLLSRTQTGKVRQYAALIAAGAAFLIILAEVL